MSYNALNNTISFGRSRKREVMQDDFTTQIQSDELQDNRPSVEDWAEYIEWIQENEQGGLTLTNRVVQLKGTKGNRMRLLKITTNWIIFTCVVIMAITFVMAVHQTDVFLNLHGNPWK